MIAIGNFFFKWRNYLFPFFVIGLFALRSPKPVFAGSEQLEVIKDFIGFAIVLLGLVIRGTVIGFAYIKRGGMNKKVYADKLVTAGMFTLCRNPLYLGNMLTIIGIFIVHGDLLIMSIGILAYSFIYQCIIFAEEAYLENKFGKSFTKYCEKTPRWLPVLTRFNLATKDMAFDWKRVIVKDYTTIATSLVACAAIEFYEDWVGVLDRGESLTLGFIAAVGLVVAGISLAKRKGYLKLA
jgi:protein-S-isoprenylcysteine O-methyltransferase Ste14